MRLGNRLRETRLQNELTQEALARSARVTRQTIISIEKGRFVPSVRLALELARVLRVPLEEVFWLEAGKGVKP